LDCSKLLRNASQSAFWAAAWLPACLQQFSHTPATAGPNASWIEPAYVWGETSWKQCSKPRDRRRAFRVIATDTGK
jgi:hypothetical protein